MSTLTSSYDTLVDHAKQVDQNGEVVQYVEALSQDNEIVQDMIFTQCNKVDVHESTVEVAYPDVYWKMAGVGIPASNGSFAQIKDGVGIMESWSKVEKMVADLGGNPARYRMNKAKQHLAAQGVEFASTFFYGAASNPEEFIGLAPRYSSLSAVNAENIINAQGSGNDNCSIWLLGMGEQKLHGIFAKGYKAGFDRVDHGIQVEQNWGGSGKNAEVYTEKFTFHGGLCLADWRYAARICNIDVSNLTTKTNAADLIELMIKLIYRIPGSGQGGTKLKFYMNRTCQEFLDLQGRDAVISGGGLDFDNVGGKRIMSLRGIPIGRCDALLESEAAVT